MVAAFPILGSATVKTTVGMVPMKGTFVQKKLALTFSSLVITQDTVSHKVGNAMETTIVLTTAMKKIAHP
jgi:hypothetical protein